MCIAMTDFSSSAISGDSWRSHAKSIEDVDVGLSKILLNPDRKWDKKREVEPPKVVAIWVEISIGTLLCSPFIVFFM